jgi:outer membrane lipoprotein-sorting protein
MVPFRSRLAEVTRPAQLRLLLLVRETRPKTRRLFLLFALFGVLSAQPPGVAAEQSALLSSWLSAQTNLQTWSADVTQTRALKTLTQPLTARGRIWFAAPNRFRWELTSPSPTIAVRQPEQMLVIYPKLKRAERYPLNGDQAGPWKDALSLLEAGFPRNQVELESRFNVVSQAVSNATLDVVLEPKSLSARRLMPRLRIVIATSDFTPRATELLFADGSTMRNDFSNATPNPKLNDALFAPKLESDFKLVEPTKGR